MPDSVLRSIDYEARRGSDGDVEITVTVERTVFVKQMIPDGQLAGTIGHLPKPSTAEYVFNMHPEQARRLRDQLDEILR